MKKQIALILIFILSSLMIWSSCEDYATSVDPLIDQVEDDRLTNESSVEFLINGLNTRFATTHDVLMLIAGLLSDELLFDPNIPNATFPTFRDIDLPPRVVPLLKLVPRPREHNLLPKLGS